MRHDVGHAQVRAQARGPPREAVLAHALPAVERVAPELAGLAEVVGRDAGDRARAKLLVEVEQLGVRPHVRAVERDVDRRVAEDRTSLLARRVVQRLPLLEEQELRERVEVDLLAKLAARSSSACGSRRRSGSGQSVQEAPPWRALSAE
jgi:hypothetical protein